MDELVRTQFLDWDADPIADENDGAEPLALKYQGLCEASEVVRGEVQIMSMLVGLFWEVEHSAMYKADPKFKGVAESLEMQECRQDVHRALRRFEDTFESIIDRR